MSPAKHLVDFAVEIAGMSPCRSKRGVVIFTGDDIISHGYNYKPRGFACDGSEACKATCRREAVHAEQWALLSAGNRAHASEMLHVKAVDGKLVPSGGPSCVECSKLARAAGIAWMWLYHADGWQRYEMAEFHRLSLAADQPETPAAPPAPGHTATWAVMVERNGENVVTLASNHMAGRDLSEEDERVVRMAADHLLAFLAKAKPCIIGEYCRNHGFIHGAEAEELRKRVETILAQIDHEGDDAAAELDRALRIMLDEVDARDSVAYLERASAAAPPAPEDYEKPHDGSMRDDMRCIKAGSTFPLTEDNIELRRASAAAPVNRPHEWTTSTDKNKCDICGDGPWGRHRFQEK